ncbi:ferrichrome-iron receptor [Nostoc sp. PCC 7120 = FACHB-418]|nr:ferrichrome-iron receptor [Nostoc sp. PCC 7120 = FACHB-418]
MEVILETTAGDKLQVANRSTGNNFIVDVAGGQLRLPNGDAFTFKSEKPIEGITEITATNIDVNTVRVTVVGEKALPAVELFDDDTGLIFAVASKAISAQTPETPTEEKPAEEKPEEQPAAQQDDPIELVVTGEADSYGVPNASTATRTDTPLRDIPQSIQVVPQEVLRDRKVRSVNEAVQTVSGVVDGGTIYGAPSGIKTIRGFTQGFAVGGTENLRNGVPDADYIDIVPIGTIEQVEVLKGPASVLFGGVEPGGVINTITKQPLGEPYYQIAFEAGNYGYYQPSIDLSGPLTADKTVLYRLIAGYEHSNNIQTPFPPIGWKYELQELAQILGKETVSQQLIDRSSQRIEQLKQALGDRRHTLTVSVVATGEGIFWGYGQKHYSGTILEEIGLQRPRSQMGDLFYLENISEEMLSDIDGDVLFFTLWGNRAKTTLDKLQRRPLWQQLNAVQRNQVYFVGEHWHEPDIFAINAILDDLEKYLINSQKNQCDRISCRLGET